jgi:hypothetical protein
MEDRHTRDAGIKYWKGWMSIVFAGVLASTTYRWISDLALLNLDMDGLKQSTINSALGLVMQQSACHSNSKITNFLRCQHRHRRAS